MHALVTGGAGFIGSHLVDALVRRKHRVRVLDNLTTGTLRNLELSRNKIEFIRGDIRDTRTLRRAIRGTDVIFHQAALRSVPKSVERPLEFHEVNITATVQLLCLAHEVGVRRVVYASSSSVYGDSQLPQRESMVAHPQSPYAVSKLAGEIYCSMFTQLYGLKTVSLRYFNVFGPRQSLENKYAVVVPKFIVCLLKGEHPPIHGDGLQTRDFTYIDNVIHANLLAAASPKASGQVFNIACGHQHSVRNLAEILGRQIGVPVNPRFTPSRPGDVKHTRADIRKAQRLFGYKVQVQLEEGLIRTTDWFKQHPQAWVTQ